MENWLDVLIPHKIIQEVIELAEIYGFGFNQLQCSPINSIISIEYEDQYYDRIIDFISDVNIVRDTFLLTEQN